MHEHTAAAEPPRADRVLAVRYIGWTALGADVRLDLGGARTVLVGRNAAGKSLLLEGFEFGADLATISTVIREDEQQFGLTMELEIDGSIVEYEFQRTAASGAGGDERLDYEWRERCVYRSSGALLWQSEPGALTFGDGRRMVLLGHESLLSLRSTNSFALPPEVERIQRLLDGVRMMRAGVPRSEPLRMATPARKSVRGRWSPVYRRGREGGALVRLIFLYETDRELFETVATICRRLELLREIEVRIEEVEHRTPPTSIEATHFGEVLIDGVDFGYLSDGTLRVIELVLHLVDPRTTVLLLEEPETSIHPGLLTRVLAEIDAYSSERQIVVSTHSLALVDWSQPDEIRLVERSEGRTSVRGLSDDERSRLKFYLDEDLGLADFLFSGGVE